MNTSICKQWNEWKKNYLMPIEIDCPYRVWLFPLNSTQMKMIALIQFQVLTRQAAVYIHVHNNKITKKK